MDAYKMNNTKYKTSMVTGLCIIILTYEMKKRTASNPRLRK
jgi:hypothetical protein